MKKKRMKYEARIQITLVLITVFIITLIYYFVQPTLIGLTVLQGYKIDITNASNFNYNSSEIEIADGIISLKQIITVTNYTQEKIFTAYVESATRSTPDETVDATEEVSTLDGNITNADKNQVFDVTFNETLGNNDTLNFYLRGINDGSQTDIYLCQLSMQCASPGHGIVSYDGSEGWFFITIENLSSPMQGFNIDPPVKVRFDYINATKIILEEYSKTNISYPSSSAITAEISVQDLTSWNALEVEEILNNQNISYEFSADSGLTWESIPENKSLTNTSISAKKIMIKIILYSNTTATPSISLLNITYSTKEPQKYFEINNTALISTIENENITVNSTASKIELNIVASETLSNIQLNISELKETRPSNLSRLREIEILSEQLQNKISAATIKVYYTENEIENLDESTLKIYYFNETSEEWQAQNSTINEEENYILADLQHFSIYGVFGEKINSESSSPSSGSGGSGGKREFTRGTTTPQQTQQEQESSASGAEEEAAESPQERTEPKTIQTEAQVSQVSQVSDQSVFTGNIINIGKVLTEGKTNRSLWILLAILTVAYIIAKIEERK